MPTSATNVDEARSCPRKRTLSTKAATNGDPHAERKRQKLDEVQNKVTKKALTKKGATTRASNVATTAPEDPSVTVEETSDKEPGDGDDDELLEDHAPNPDSDFIVIDDDEPEAPEESAEAELRKFFFS
jgi:hypothetical protein